MREKVALACNQLIEGLAELESSNDLNASTIRRKDRLVALYDVAVGLKAMLFDHEISGGVSEAAPVDPASAPVDPAPAPVPAP